VQNPVYVLGEYLIRVSSAEQLERNPLMEPGTRNKVNACINTSKANNTRTK